MLAIPGNRRGRTISMCTQYHDGDATTLPRHRRDCDRIARILTAGNIAARKSHGPQSLLGAAERIPAGENGVSGESRRDAASFWLVITGIRGV